MASKGNTISTKLVLDGEKEFKAELDQAYDAIKKLKQGLSITTAEMGRNASAQDKATAKSKTLVQQIKQQEKVVAMLEKALGQAKKQYPENTAVQAQWADKLTKSNDVLNNMYKSLETATKTMEVFDEATKGADASTDKAMQATVSFNDVLKDTVATAKNIAGAVGGAFDATANTVKKLYGDMYSLMSGAWGRVGNYKELQAMWGGDSAEIERIMLGAGTTGHDSSVLSTSIQQLVNRTHAGTKETTKALKSLGITEKDYASHWDYWMAVMNRLSETGQTNGKIITDLFGKSGASISSTLEDWSVVSTYSGPAVGGNIDMLDETGKAVDKLTTFYTAFKDYIGGELAVKLNFIGLTDDAVDILDTVYRIFQAPDGETRKELTADLTVKIEALTEDAEQALSNLGAWIQDISDAFKASDNETVQAIGRGLDAFGKLLDWIANNADTIIGVLSKWLRYKAIDLGVEATTGRGVGDWAGTAADVGVNLINIAMLKKAMGWGAGKAAAGAAGSGAGSWLAGAGMASMRGIKWLAKLAPLAAFTSISTHVSDTVDGGIYDKNGNVLPGIPVNEDGTPMTLREKAAQEASWSPMQSTLEQWWDDYRNDWFPIARGSRSGAIEELRGITDNDSDLINHIYEMFQTMDKDSMDLPDIFWRTMDSYLQKYMDTNQNQSKDDEKSSAQMDKMRTAAQQGVRDGMRGMTVMLDGNTIAGYVSTYLAQDAVTVQ